MPVDHNCQHVINKLLYLFVIPVENNDACYMYYVIYILYKNNC